MRNGVLPSLLGAALLLASGLPLTAGPDGEPITVELKDFEFKVREELASLFSYNEGEGKLCFYTNGQAQATVKIPADAEYEITVKASCDSAQNERAKFKLSIDGQLVDKETLLTDDGEKDYKFTVKLKAGERKLVIEFTNDVYKENEFDRNLYVHGVTLKKK
jgi:Ca-dependent carbohydrate-binding module xylan-binding